MRFLPSVLRLTAVLVALSLAGASAAEQAWTAQPRVEDVSYQGALDLTADVRRGAGFLQLVPPVTIGGDSWDGVLVGEGFVHFLHLSEGRIPGEPSEEAGAPSDRPSLGPRIDVLGNDGLQLARDARALVRLQGDRLAVRWTGLRAPGLRGLAIAEILIAPDDVRVQYLHLPEGFAVPGGAAATATSFRLLDAGKELVLSPRAPVSPMSTDPPPPECDPAPGTWCAYTGTGCGAGNSTPCSTRVEDRWSFNESGFCKDCPYVFYVLVECGREMHFPMHDMEGFDMTITNMVTGQRPDLRCVNDTALGNGPANGWRRTCSGVSNTYWPPPLDVTNNAGQGHVVASDSTPGDGDCTTSGDPTCAELPPGGGVAATVVYGEDQNIDCFVHDDTGLCGIYRIEMVSGGFVWQLFSNCDGTDTPQFNIYWDCTEAWAAYDPLPELAIQNATTSGDCWTYDVGFEIENIGCIDETADVPVRIESACGDRLDVLVPGPVPAHGLVSFTQRMTLSCPESTLTITVDPDDDVLECTESSTAAACAAEAGNDRITVDTQCCPVVDAGANKTACHGDPVPLPDASSQFGDVFSWSDGGAGGTFSPSASVRNPSYLPASGLTGPVTLTLTVTFSGSGCFRQDSLVVDVRARPVPDAGTPKAGCAGDAVALADAAAPGADAFLWSDGGAGGTFEPSADVRNPAYRNTLPGAHVLTFQATLVATNCSATDTVTVTLHADPIVSAGVDREICEDATAVLDDGSAGSAHDLTWSDGGAGGTFTPSARVLHPTYVPSGPGTFALTLTGTELHVFEPISGAALARDDMEGGVPAQWTPASAETTPSGRAFLGRFSGSDAVTLELTGLPAHSQLSTCFELFVIGSWDGHAQAGAPVGPDLFEVRLDGGPVLLHSSFASAAPRAQAWPGAYVDALGTASPSHPPRTGAAEIDTLGYGGGDSVYRVSLTFAHSGPTLRLVFQGLGLEGLADESWGLDDVYVGLQPCASCTDTDVAELVVHALPGADAGPDTGACAGDAVSLDGAAPGTADTFAWSDGGAGGTFLPSATELNPTYEQPALGPHVLTLTSTSLTTGCTSVDSVVVTIGERPAVDAGPGLQTCAGTAVAIPSSSAGTADTFTWNDGGAGGTFQPSAHVLHPQYLQQQAGIFTLTLTASESATTCSNADSVQVQVNANPLLEAGTDKTGCAEAGIPLDDAFAGSGTTVLWSDGGAGGTFTPSASVLEPAYSNATPGTYVLTLQATRPSTGCVSSDSLQVTVLANPAVNAGADKASCAGAQVTLADSSSSGTTLLWSDAGSGGTFTPSASALHPAYRNDAPGTYVLRLTATGAGGCTREDTLSIVVSPNPAVNAGTDKDACVSSPVALADATSSADTFSWSDGGGGGTFTPSPNVRNPSYSNATPGARTLTLTASVSATGCQSQDTVVVTVRQLPVAAFAPIGGPWCEDVPVCFDNTSTGGTSWSWSFGAGGNSTQFEPCFTYSSPGTYTVQLTALNVCGSDLESRQITIQPKPVADFSYSTQGGRFCKDRPITFTDLSTGSPTSWQWDFGDGVTSTAQNPTHAYTTDGLFIVQLRACNGCGCGPPRFQAIEIVASCQTNCEANSNQIGCTSGPATQTGNTCTDHSNFNTTSYPCAPGIIYSGEDKIFDLNFPSGANFIVRLIETVPEPNGYELDVMMSDSCNPPNCVAWGDTELRYDDRTATNDDFFLIVDGRDGTCGPYRLEVECLSPSASSQCTPPVFSGITQAFDEDACSIPGIVVQWPSVTNWGKDRNGAACSSGTFEIWRAPTSDLQDERRVGTAPATATQFVDRRAVPRESFTYRVNAINDCCAQPAITTPTDEATDDFGNTIEVDAGTGGTITCLQPAVQLLGSASGGTGTGFTFAWSPAAGLSDPTIPNPTATLGAIYTLTVTDAGDGCSMIDTVVVVGDAVLPTADAGPDRELTCASATATLQGSALGGNGSGGYSYAWSPAGLVANPAAPSTTTSTPGTYTLTVTALATGCTDTDTVVVTSVTAAPVANAGANAELTCATDQVVLQGSASGGDGSDGYLYSWSPATGLSDPTSAQPTASMPGTYVLLVTDAHSGCTDTDSVVVQLNAEAPVADAGPDRALGCSGAPVTLDGSALGGDGSEGYEISWSPPEGVSDPSAEDPTTQVAGTYLLTVTDVRTGCTATDSVVVAPGPGPVASAGPDRSITCSAGTVSLQGSASGGDGSQGYAYAWSPAGLVADPSSPTTTTSTPGSYVLTVTSVADGCSGSDAVLVADLTGGPVASAGPDRVLTCATGTATLQGSATDGDASLGRTFAWSPPGQVSDPSSPVPTTSTPGTYTLTVTDLATGCSDTDTVAVAADTAPPVAEAGPGATLTCAVTSVPLQGSASGGNASAGRTFAWSPAGSVTDPSSATTSATAPGTYTLTVTDDATGCTDTDAVTIAQDIASPVANAGADQALACGSTVTLTGSASGGNGSSGYSYRWEPAGGVSNPDAATTQASAAGTYVLTATAIATGCTDTDTVIVTSTGAPVANAGPDSQITCSDGTASLSGSVSGGNGSQGFTASWTPAAGVASPSSFVTTATIPGTYTLRVTDVATGCVAVDVMIVADATEAPVAEAGPSPRVTCSAGTATLQGSASGADGSQGYAFSWQPSALVSYPAVAAPTTSTPGTYVLTVTDVATGCVGTDTVVVQDGRLPPLASAGGDQVRDCAHPVATLAGSGGGGDGSGGFTYAWSPAGSVSDPSSPTPTTSIAGAYTLTVTDVATGCTDQDVVVVTDDFAAPVASAGPDVVLDCDDPIVQLQGAGSGGNGSRGWSYAWSPAAGLSNPTSAAPFALQAGTYQLTVTDRANGCTGTDTVLVSDLKAPPVANAGADQRLDCDTPSVTLTGSASGGSGAGGRLFAWEPASGVADPDAAITETATAGTYTLTVTDVATGCSDQDVVVVTQDERAPRAQAGPDRLVDCAHPSVTLSGSATGGNATAGYAFRWEPAAQVSNADIAAPSASLPGTYVLTVTALATGCTDTDSVVVAESSDAPVANAGPDRSIDCDDAAVTLLGSASGGDASQGYSYAWTPAAPLSNASSPSPATSTPGTYTLTVTAIASGCTGTDTVTVLDRRTPPTASAGADQLLDCDSSRVTLDGSASGGDGSLGFAWAWSPAGAVSNPSIPRPTTGLAGTYVLTVTDLVTGCVGTDTVVIGRDERPPVANAGTDRRLDCATPSVTLQGSASGGNASSGYSFAWSPAASVSDPASATPTTSVAGTYTLTVTALATGCADTDTVLVVRDDAPPSVSAGPDAVLDCAHATVLLQGSASGANGSLGYSFAWAPAAGLSDPSAEQPLASVPGTWTLTVTDLLTGCVASDTVTVTRDVAAPVASAGPDRILDCSAPSVTLSGSGSGGNGSLGYAYAWEPAGGVTDPTAAVTEAVASGTYTLTVTDLANGCTDSDVVVVASSQAPPVADAGPDGSVSCLAGIASLSGSASGGDGSAGYLTTWTPSAGVGDPAAAATTTTEPGTYTLLVEDLATGCRAADSVTIADDRAAPTADAGPARVLTCAASSVVLQGSASGGNGTSGWTFAWEPAASVSDPAAAQPSTTQPGTYTLTVTDAANGCTATDSVVVTRDAAPPSVSAGPDLDLGCRASVVLQGSGSPGSTFSWSPAASVSDPAAAQPTASAPGTYVLTVTSGSNGCTATDSVVIGSDATAPVAAAGPDRLLSCAQPSVTLQGSASGGRGTLGYAFAWTPAVGVSDPASAQPQATSPGTYVLTVTDLANGCTDTDEVEVTADIDAPAANAGSDAVLDCGAAGVTLTGSASGGNGSLGYSYRWEPAGAVTSPDTATTDATAAGTFTLTVTDLANGCTASDAVVVTLSQDPPIANAGPDALIRCDRPGASLQGSASGGDGRLGYAASWTPAAGVANPSAFSTTASIPGTYTLTVTDLFTSCRSFDTVVVTQDAQVPSVSVGPGGTITCAVATAPLTGSASGGNGSQGYTYRWSPDTGVANPASPSTTTTEPGTYTLTVTDRANGCSASDVVVIAGDDAVVVANAGPNKQLTCVTTTVTLDGSVSGGNGTGGFSYAWTPAADVSNPSSPTPTTSVARTYTLTVVDLVTGCADTDTVTVATDRVAPNANAGTDATLTCLAPVVTLTAAPNNANYRYAWSPAADVSDPVSRTTTTSVPGTYTVTITDIRNGCSDTDAVLVADRRGAPAVSAGPDKSLTCVAGSVTLDGSVTGVAGAVFSWSPAAFVSDPAIAQPSVTAAGTYTLTVTDPATGCSGSDSVDVVLDADAPVASAGADVAIDCGAVARLSGSATGGHGSYAFAWSPAQGLSDATSPAPEVTAPGTYVLTVTDVVNGCTSTDDVVVTLDQAPPIADAGADVPLPCAAPGVALTGAASGGNGSAGYRFAWSPPGAVSDPASASTTALAAGTFTLTVTDLASGCVGADAVVVSSAGGATVQAGRDTGLRCSDGLADLAATVSGGDTSGGRSYSWSPAAGVADPSSPVTTTSAAGEYTLVVTDLATGCRAADSIVVGPLAPVVADAGPDVRITCAEPTPVLQGSVTGGNGSQGLSWSWSPEDAVTDPAAPRPRAVRAGTLTLTVTDLASGCSSTDTVTVDEDAGMPRAGAGPDRVLDCATPSATLSGSVSGGNGASGFRFAWEPAADVANPAAPTTTTTIPGTYVLTVTDVATGCLSSDAVIVTRAVPPAPFEPSALDRRPGAEPLRVAWASRASGTLRLTWEPLPAGLLGRAYQGTIAALRTTGYDHGFVACSIAPPRFDLRAPAGNVYFLVTGANCAGDESSYGRSSLGAERPDAAAASGRACP